MLTELTKVMQYDRALIISAITQECLDLVRKEYADWLDNNGYYPFYEMMVEITDEVLFADGSDYRKAHAMGVENIGEYYQTEVKRCFDWHCMELGAKLIREKLKGHESKKD